MKNRIRELREKMGWTQAQLGELAGISRQAVGALECGKSEPSIWLAYDLSHIFTKSIEEIFLFEISARKSRADSSRREPYGSTANQNI